MRYFTVLLEVRQQKVDVVSIFEISGVLEDMQPTHLHCLWDLSPDIYCDKEYHVVVTGTNGLLGYLRVPRGACAGVDPALRDSYAIDMELCCIDNSVAAATGSGSDGASSVNGNTVSHSYNTTITAIAVDSVHHTLISGDAQGIHHECLRYILCIVIPYYTILYYSILYYTMNIGILCTWSYDVDGLTLITKPYPTYEYIYALTLSPGGRQVIVTHPYQLLLCEAYSSRGVAFAGYRVRTVLDTMPNNGECMAGHSLHLYTMYYVSHCNMQAKYMPITRLGILRSA